MKTTNILFGLLAIISAIVLFVTMFTEDFGLPVFTGSLLSMCICTGVFLYTAKQLDAAQN